MGFVTIECMPYHTYQTEGVILEAFNSGENNRSLVVFTRELGLVRVYAKSSREVRSKLRPLLQKFSYVDLSVVRGKGTFRVTGAEERFNLYYELAKEDSARLSENANHSEGAKMRALLRIYNLLLRLLQGQEKDEKLYDVVRAFTEYLKKGYNIDKQLSALELLVVARLLHRLGYLEEFKETGYSLENIGFDQRDIDIFNKNYNKILSKVNRALESSEL